MFFVIGKAPVTLAALSDLAMAICVSFLGRYKALIHTTVNISDLAFNMGFLLVCKKADNCPIVSS